MTASNYLLKSLTLKELLRMIVIKCKDKLKIQKNLNSAKILPGLANKLNQTSKLKFFQIQKKRLSLLLIESRLKFKTNIVKLLLIIYMKKHLILRL